MTKKKTVPKLVRPIKFMIVSDIHGNEQDAGAVAAALKFSTAFKPDIRVIAGDLWDFAAIRKGASEEDRSQSMWTDFEAGKKFADDFYTESSANHLLLGNHDIRVWDMFDSTDGVKRDLADVMIGDIKLLARKHDAILYPYDSREGVLKIGHLKVVHGFHTGVSACALHARIYGNVVFGHIHSIESYQVPGLDQREARSIGCLCKLNQKYIDRKTAKLRWSHGWAYGWLFSDGTYQINQARSIDGNYYATREITTY